MNSLSDDKSLQSQLEQLQKENWLLKRKIDRKTADLAKFEGELTQTRAEKDDMVKQNRVEQGDMVKQIRAEQDDLVKQHKAERNDFLDKIDDLEDDNEILKASLQSLRTSDPRTSDTSGDSQEMKRLISALDKAKIEVLDLRRQKDQLKATVSDCDRTISLYIEYSDVMDDGLKSLGKVFERLNGDHQSLIKILRSHGNILQKARPPSSPLRLCDALNERINITTLQPRLGHPGEEISPLCFKHDYRTGIDSPPVIEEAIQPEPSSPSSSENDVKGSVSDDEAESEQNEHISKSDEDRYTKDSKGLKEISKPDFAGRGVRQRYVHSSWVIDNKLGRKRRPRN
ncbi:MAG: hypothetical protein Q9170_006706 [Blastenia crenularia]